MLHLFLAESLYEQVLYAGDRGRSSGGKHNINILWPQSCLLYCFIYSGKTCGQVLKYKKLSFQDLSPIVLSSNRAYLSGFSAFATLMNLSAIIAAECFNIGLMSSPFDDRLLPERSE